jgi:hypothetical protein
MLLDGDITLTERVPLELHVNTCGECRQRLADLQMFKDMPQRPAPRHVHWRPILAAGLVGRALEAMRPDDVFTRLRRLLVDRIPPRHLVVAQLRRLVVDRVPPRHLAVTRLRRLVVDRIPPRHLAVAAAVPLVVTLAIFLFERGFTVGVEMRQHAPSAPVSMSSNPPASTPSSAPLQPAPVQGPPAPALPAPSTSSPAPAAPSPVPPPAEKAKVAETKVSETKPMHPKAVTQSAKPESGPKPDKSTLVTTSKPAPAKSAPASIPPAASEVARKETPSKNVAVARAAPTRPAATPVAPAAAVTENRRGSVDVVGRLQVKSRSEAERNLAALVARAGGTAVSRQRGPGITVVEAAVPHANYGKFSQGVVRLGSWRVEAERFPLPDLVQVTVRLAE